MNPPRREKQFAVWIEFVRETESASNRPIPVSRVFSLKNPIRPTGEHSRLFRPVTGLYAGLARTR